MRHTLLSSFALTLACAFPAFASDVEVAGKVSTVTLFSRGAEVTRSAHTAIPAGEHTLVFRGIPQGVQSDSLRASGSGAAAIRIQGVEFKTRARREDLSAVTEALRKKREVVTQSIATNEKTKERLAREQSLLAGVQLDLPVPDGDKVLRPRSAQEMTALLQFISQNGTRLQDELRVVDEKLSELHKDLAVIDAELQKMAPGSMVESVVEVAVVAEGAGEADVAITYQVPNAGWSPAYNLLAASAEGRPSFTVESYGVLQQRTGEDWERVRLVLSTARPQLGLSRPVPSARFLDVFQPIVRPAAVAMKAIGGAYRGMSSELAMDNAAAPQEAGALLEDKVQAQSFEEVDADISTGAVVRYTLPAPVTLRSDGSNEKVRIRATELSGKVLNVAVPSSSTEVYREAALTNAADAPLLQGAVSVFANGSFVGRQAFGYTSPGKEIKLPIGLSDEVGVKRKLVEKFEDDSGLVRSIRRIRYVYEIEAENHTAAEQQVVLLEPAPVSRNEKIKVQLSSEEPKSLPASDTSRIQPDAGVFEWRLVLPPKQKQTIRYEFSVEFEASLNITGLEGL